MNCPHCGKRIDWSNWQKREYTTFAAGGMAIPAGAEYERRRPARDANLESDVFSPALQSLITGVTAGVCGAAATAMSGLDQHPAVVGLTAGTAILSVTWIVLLRDHRALLWEVERIVGADLDEDGHIGPPASPPRTPIRIEVSGREGKYRRIRYIDLPHTIRDEDIASIARAVLVSRKKFSRRDLDISPEVYRDLSERMLEGGLLRYRGKGPRSGLELTGAGRAFLRQFLEIK